MNDFGWCGQRPHHPKSLPVEDYLMLQSINPLRRILKYCGDLTGLAIPVPGQPDMMKQDLGHYHTICCAGLPVRVAIAL